MGKEHGPEEIIGKLREAEIILSQGGTTGDACCRIAVTEQAYYRWRKEYGGLKPDRARRLKVPQKQPWRSCLSLAGRLPTSGPTVAQNLSRLRFKNGWLRSA